MKHIRFFGAVWLLLFLAACGNLEKEIELELPQYQSQVVVECYLEPGQPFSLLLTRSAAYFDAFGNGAEFVNSILEDSAKVFISYENERIELTEQLIFNPFSFKVFNYGNTTELVPADTNIDFFLEIETKDKEVITAQTRIMPVVPIDSLVVEYPVEREAKDTLARVLTYLTDPPDETNLYRRMLHNGSLDSLEQDFLADDGIVENGTLAFGTNFSYAVGDTIIATIVHLSDPYYRFLNSISFATNANGNPFGQPSSIISNVEGENKPLGIFTGLSYDRKSVIIPE